jgi:hypothetical protein
VPSGPRTALSPFASRKARMWQRHGRARSTGLPVRVGGPRRTPIPPGDIGVPHRAGDTRTRIQALPRPDTSGEMKLIGPTLAASAGAQVILERRAEPIARLQTRQLLSQHERKRPPSSATLSLRTKAGVRADHHQRHESTSHFEAVERLIHPSTPTYLMQRSRDRWSLLAAPSSGSRKRPRPLGPG